MSFVTPPTFVDGAVLTATQLNQLSDGVRFLNGLGGQSIGATLMVNHTSDTPAVYYYAGRHTHRYLHILYVGTLGDDLLFENGATTVYHDGNPENGYVDAVVDLQTVLPDLAVGQWYVLTATMSTQSAGDSIAVWWVGESQSAATI
jgi:hypothetical protein